MRVLIPLLLLCIDTIGTTNAKFLNYNVGTVEIMMVACQRTIDNSVSYFPVGQAPGGFDGICISEPYLVSFLNCMYVQLENIGSFENREFLRLLKKRCSTLNPSKFDNASPNELAIKLRLTHLSYLDFKFNWKTVPKASNGAALGPIQYDENAYSLFLDGYQTTVHNANLKVNFSIILLSYWGVLVLIGIINRALTYLLRRRRRYVSRYGRNVLVRKFYQYVVIPALYGKKHAVEITGGEIIPTRLQFLVNFVFSLLLIILLAVGYRTASYDMANPTKHLQILSHYAHRAGSFAIFMVPLTFLFGTRNNIMMWLTGWKQSTFLAFHKYISYMLVLTAITHASSMINGIISKGIGNEVFKMTFIKGGILAFAAILLFLVQPMAWLRRKRYHIFLLTHVLLSLIFLAGICVHLKDIDQHIAFFYATLAVWAFDKFARLVRIFLFGGVTDATVMAKPDDDTLKIIIPKHASSIWKTFPGAYGYVYFLNGLRFWDSHPFTILEDEKTNTINCYIKVKCGITKSLYESIVKEQNNSSCPTTILSAKIKVLVEGPYGDMKPLHVYDKILLYAGGHGIPGLYAYARKLGEYLLNGHQSALDQKQVMTCPVKFYWIIPTWSSVQWYYNELELLRPYSDFIKIIIYVTRVEDAPNISFPSPTSGIGTSMLLEPKESTDSNLENNLKTVDPVKSRTISDTVEVSNYQNISGSLMNSLSFIEFRPGKRPDITTLVSSDIREASESSSIAVMSCAHPKMCDNIRAVVTRESANKKPKALDFFEELQVW